MKRFVMAVGLAALVAGATPGGAAAQQRFAELAFSNDGRIFSLFADGSARTLLVKPATRIESVGDPAWSPDGRTLAYVRTERRGQGRGDDDRSQIMVTKGSARVALTPLRKGVSDFQPAWSPDGARLAFVRSIDTRRSFVQTIRTIGRTGGAEAEIARSTSSPRFTSVSGPAWRPDGWAIAYARASLGQQANAKVTTLVADVDGRNPRPLVDRGGPAKWSPDGRWLTFMSIRDRNGERCFSDGCIPLNEIYVSRADGSGARRLTRNRGDDEQPTWSPDGSRILFSSDRNFPAGRNPEIYSIAPDGSCLTWLTNGTPSSWSPAWRPGRAGTAASPRCGDAGRKPLAEVRPPRRAPRGGLWLGKSYRGLLLSSASGSRRSAFFGYGDCGLFHPRQCPPEGVDVSSTSICSRDAFEPALKLPVRWRVRRGAVVGYQSAGGSLEIYSGRAKSAIGFEESFRGPKGEQARALRNLRPFRGRAKAGARLPAPRIPVGIARKLRGAERARPARRSLRHRLRFARTLRKVGGFRAVRCR